MVKPTRLILAVAFLSGLGATGAVANCDIADAQLEQAIAQKPEFRAPANRQMVRDLRGLRIATA